jgi:hypothetical protein
MRVGVAIWRRGGRWAERRGSGRVAGPGRGAACLDEAARAQRRRVAAEGGGRAKAARTLRHPQVPGHRAVEAAHWHSTAASPLAPASSLPRTGARSIIHHYLIHFSFHFHHSAAPIAGDPHEALLGQAARGRVREAQRAVPLGQAQLHHRAPHQPRHGAVLLRASRAASGRQRPRPGSRGMFRGTREARVREACRGRLSGVAAAPPWVRGRAARAPAAAPALPPAHTSSSRHARGVCTRGTAHEWHAPWQAHQGKDHGLAAARTSARPPASHEGPFHAHRFEALGHTDGHRIGLLRAHSRLQALQRGAQALQQR